MKKILLMLYFVCMVGIPHLAAEGAGENINGGELFQKRNCAVCHDATKDQSRYGLGPSLKQISEAYKGREEECITFLKGGCKPRMDESRFPIMHEQVVSLKDLSDSQVRSLSRFILQQEIEK